MFNHKGLTLHEVVTSLIVISILLGISAPFLQTMVQRSIFRTEVSLLFRGLQQAKITAIKTRNRVVLKVKGNGYSIFVDDGSGGGRPRDWVQQVGEKTILSRQMKHGITLTTTFSGNRGWFNGRVTTAAGSVVFTDVNGNGSKVVVNMVGRIRVEKL